MKQGILVFGMNGVGKSTFGKALSEEINAHFIDNEDLYFKKDNPFYEYDAPKTHEEVEKILYEELSKYSNFVFAAVKGDYGEKAISLFDYAIMIEVPREIRLERVKNRSAAKFGDRMLPGGDLYERESAFLDKVINRSEDLARKWSNVLTCPIITIDGTEPIDKNIRQVIEKLNLQVQ